MRTRAASTAWTLAMGLALLATPPAEAKKIGIEDLTNDPGLMPLATDWHGNVHTQDGRIIAAEDYTVGRRTALFAPPQGRGEAATSADSRFIQGLAPSRVSIGTTIDGMSYNPPGSSLSIVETLGPRYSGNGQYIIFESRAAFDFADQNGVPDIYRQNLATGEIQLISKTFGLTGTPNNSAAAANPAFRVGAFSPAISDDGTKVAFYSGLILNDVHQNFTWGQWRDTGAADPVRGAPANASEEVGMSTEVAAYWAELDANGDIISLKISDFPADNVPGFSPGAPFIEGLDIDPTGRYVVFSRSNANLQYDVDNLTAAQVGFQDRQIWLYDSQTETVKLLTNRAVTDDFTGYRAWVASAFNPVFSPVRFSGNGQWITVGSSTRNSNTNLHGSPTGGALVEAVAFNVADKANPGPPLRVTLRDGDIPSVANNRATSSPLLARTLAESGLESGNASNNGLNESVTFSPTDPTKALFFSQNYNGPVALAADYSVQGSFTANGVGVCNPVWFSAAIFLKDVSNGDLDIIVSNRGARYGTGSASFWNGGSLGGSFVSGSLLTWSKDGASFGFLADFRISDYGFNPPPATGFLEGFVPYALPFPIPAGPEPRPVDPIANGVWDADNAVVALTNDGNALNPLGFSGNRFALEMGPNIDKAVMVVQDGSTFKGDSLLFPDVTSYDGTEPAGERLNRADLGAAVAPNANDLSARGVTSADGRYVAYVSYAANIVADDANGFPDVFLHDRQTGATELISRNQTTNAVGNSASGGHHTPASAVHEYILTGTGGSSSTEWNSIYPIDMTPDGRYIVFGSNASNLGAISVGRNQAATQALINLANPTGTPNSQIYRFDTQTGEILLVTDTFGFYDPDGTGTDPGSDIVRLPNDIASWPSISADGRYVAFQSRSEIIGEPFVLDEEAVGSYNVFVRDLTLAVTDAASDAAAYTLISDLRFSNGARSDFLGLIENIMPRISADGNRVVFTSRDDILEADAENDLEEYDIYAWERETDTIRLVSNQGGNFFDNSTLPGVPNSDRFGMSRNGAYVIFQSAAPLTNDDPDFATNTNFRDQYIWEAATGTVSFFNLGGDLDGFRYASVRNEPAISDDGNLAIFWNQGRYDEAKTDNQYSLYGVNRAENTISLLSKNGQGENANFDAIAFQDTGTPQFSHPSIANALEQEDAVGVAFDIQASNLVANDENGHRDVFYVLVSTVPVDDAIPGDIDGDGLVNTADVTFLGNVVAGLETLPDGVNGDIDGDSDVDMDDVTALADQIVNN